MKGFILLVFSMLSIQITLGQKYFMGIPEGRDSLYDLTDKKAMLNAANYRDVGSSASLKQYAPFAGDQGDYGTCAAWATTYCARTILESIANDETDKTVITNSAYAPGFVYRLASDEKDCSGSFTTDCAEQMKQNGVPKLSEFDEPCPYDLPSELFNLAEEHKIKAYAKLWNDNEKSQTISDKEKIQLVKKSISEKYPVVISIICPNSFHQPIEGLWVPTEGLDSEINHPHGRHALCVVGYDDEKYGGAFEIQNSWGTVWGNNGCVWIKYSDFAKFTYQAIEMIGFENYLNQASILSGGLKFLLSDSEFVGATYQENGTYKLNKSISSGERFRLYLNSSAPSFLYSINIDSKGEIDKIFPFQEGISPILNYKNNDVAIPSEDKQMRMDGEIGKEYLCLIYSKKALDFEGLISKIKYQNKNKTVYQKFHECFGENLITYDKINFNKQSKEIKFSATTELNDVVVVIIEIGHVD